MTANNGDRLQEQRQEFAAVFKMANEQLITAARTVSEKSWTMTLFAWRYGGVLNEIHGKPAGTGIKGSIRGDLMKTYCEELGFSTQRDARGNLGGASRVAEFRRLAARIDSEGRLREVYEEYGNLNGITRGFLRGATPEERRAAREAEERARQPRPHGYSRFVPPQDWSSYLVQNGLSREEIGACLCVVLESIGPEESMKIWDRAGRPNRSVSPADFLRRAS